MKKRKNLLKKIIFLIISIYVIYTFFVQQKTLNAYKADSNRYNEQIQEAQEKKEDLLKTMDNIESDEYIEAIAREKLNMYLPNEKLYMDISK